MGTVDGNYLVGLRMEQERKRGRGRKKGKGKMKGKMNSDANSDATVVTNVSIILH